MTLVRMFLFRIEAGILRRGARTTPVPNYLFRLIETQGDAALHITMDISEGYEELANTAKGHFTEQIRLYNEETVS